MRRTCSSTWARLNGFAGRTRCCVTTCRPPKYSPRRSVALAARTCRTVSAIVASTWSPRAHWMLFGRRGRHQRLDAARLERRHLHAVGIAVVREHRLRPAQRRRDRLDVRHQVVAVAGALADPRAHDQLTAAGIHRRLRVVGLAILMVLALAHQPAVRVAQIALP